MSQVGSIGAIFPPSHRLPAAAASAERFYIPAELKAGYAPAPAAGTDNAAEGLEALLAETLAEVTALSRDEGPLSANDAHIALFNAIMQDRSRFPAGTFHIKTDLPGGASIETEIPALDGMAAASSQNVPVISLSRMIAAAGIAG